MSRNTQTDVLKKLFENTGVVNPVDEQPFSMKSFFLGTPTQITPLVCVGYNAEARVLVLADKGEKFHYIGGIVEHYAIAEDGVFAQLEIYTNFRDRIVFQRP